MFAAGSRPGAAEHCRMRAFFSAQPQTTVNTQGCEERRRFNNTGINYYSHNRSLHVPFLPLQQLVRQEAPHGNQESGYAVNADGLTLIADYVARRAPPAARAFIAMAGRDIDSGATPVRLAQLVALASRHVRPAQALAPSPPERDAALGAGFDPSHWGLLEALRIALFLTWSRSAQPAAIDTAFRHCLRFADLGEQCALYRSLPLLTDGERFLDCATQGCRSNSRTLFEAVACDSSYPARHFDDTAWRQLVIKAIFIDAPLWRVTGLDARLSPELARMALDLHDERGSAGRATPPALWLCLGTHGGARGMRALRQALASDPPQAQAAAAWALVRAGAHDEALAWLVRQTPPDSTIALVLHRRDVSQQAFGHLAHHFAKVAP
jgi:hypothetical protein